MLISNSSGSYLDSPETTQEVMYTLYWHSRIGQTTYFSPIYLNRSHRHDDAFRPTTSSSITATEIWDDSIPFKELLLYRLMRTLIMSVLAQLIQHLKLFEIN